MIEFKKAQRTESRLRLGICGPSGAGKTWGAIAVGLGLTKDPEKILVIDTENNSASLYEDVPAKLGYQGTFYTYNLSAPYTVEKYIEAIKAAEKQFSVIVIDSFSHAWDGEGGLLDRKDHMQAKDSFAAWRNITPLHNRLVNTVLTSTAHIIVTLRAKTEYERTVENGKAKVTKLGMKPIAREGMDYEFTLVADVEREGHVAKFSKDRTQLFDEAVYTPQPLTVATGERLAQWLSGAKPAPVLTCEVVPEVLPVKEVKPDDLKPATKKALDATFTLANEMGFTVNEINEFALLNYGMVAERMNTGDLRSLYTKIKAGEIANV